MSRAGRPETGQSARSNARPAGPVGRSPAAPVLGRAGSVGEELDDRAVQGQRVQVHVGQRLALQFGGHALQHTRLGPAVEPHLDGAPVAEITRQVAPDAALIEHVQPGIEHLTVADLEVIVGRRQQRLLPRVLAVAQLLLVAHLVTKTAPRTVPALPQLRRHMHWA